MSDEHSETDPYTGELADDADLGPSQDSASKDSSDTDDSGTNESGTNESGTNESEGTAP